MRTSTEYANWFLHRQPAGQIGLHAFSIWSGEHPVVLANEAVGEDGVLAYIVAELNRIEALERELDAKEDALHQIDSWSRAYPISAFPEPDLKKARALLEAGGITLDAVSASCMRHCVEGVGKIARAALEAK